MLILPDIRSIPQYLGSFNNRFDGYRPSCANCHKKGLRRHGCYYRKPDRQRSGTKSLNPVPIQRFFCPSCRRTTSVLPECIAPRRWYMWEVQQTVLSRLLIHQSLRKISQMTSVSRSSCRRWWNWLKDRYLLHGATLRSHYPDLGRHPEYNNFWMAYWHKMPFSRAMLLCHQSGDIVP
jgi:transposase-like protein